MLKVSPSEIAKFKRCKRSWYLRYHQRWSVNPDYAPATGAALLGTRIHAALEAWYGYGIDPLDALELIYRNEVTRRPEWESDLAKEYDYARIMVSGYLEWAAEHGIDEDFEVIETETTVEASLVLGDGTTEAVVSGKLDQIVRRTFDGAYAFRDWKTVGSLHKADLLILDEQFRTYSVLLEITRGDSIRIDGGLYAMILRSKQTTRAKPPFYEHVYIQYNQREHDSMVTRLRGVLTDMDRVTKYLDAGADHRLVAYPTPMTDRCGWDCDFRHVCPLFDDGSRAEDAMRGNFVQRDPYAYRDNGLIDEIRAALPGKEEVA